MAPRDELLRVPHQNRALVELVPPIMAALSISSGTMILSLEAAHVFARNQ